MNVYEVITDRILTMLKQGVVPWRQPWSVQGVEGMPKNLVSKKEYRGVNIFLLGAQRYASPYWLTYKQCTDLGGQVRKGAQGTPVIFWKITDKKDKGAPTGKGKGKGDKSFILRYYTVFNVGQCDGLEVPELPKSDKVFNPIQECENLVKLYKTIPPVNHGGGRAFYSPDFDHIGMPEKESFHKSEEYYSTLFHELVHSTGHKDRLNREGITNPIQFASHNYSFEELVAECGAAFMCGRAGIENTTLENSAAYISHWVGKLRSEPKWIVDAASKAAKAVDYILGIDASKKEAEPASESEAA